MGKNLTHREFIERFITKQPILASEIDVVGRYVSMKEKILIEDKYGELLVFPKNLIRGDLPSIRSAIDKTSYMVGKFVDIHGDRFCYENAKYINAKEKVKIICNECSLEFLQRVDNHMSGQGCPCCFEENGARKKITESDLISKFKKIHGDRYDYSKVVYFGYDEKVSIICPIHGEFMQTPHNHIRGCGCNKCSIFGWNTNSKIWLNKANNSNNFDEYKLYKLKLYNDSEEFYKIGITFRNLYDRICEIPYNCEIIEIITSTNGEYIWNLEKELHETHYIHGLQYTPLLRFDGSNECFIRLI